MEKTLNIEQMVKEYTSTTNKVAREKFMEKIEVEPYISYSAKMLYAQRIVENTSWDVANKKIQVDSPIRYLLYIYTLITAYTNIDMHRDNILPEYDALTSAGLKDLIITKIPESERKQFDTVLKMVTDDYYVNHFETHAYIDSLMDRFRNIVENFFSPISADLVKGFEKLSSDEVANAITTAVSQIGQEKPSKEEPELEVKKPRKRKQSSKTEKE